MPRTSYGDDKCEQAWNLINTLLQVRGTSQGNYHEVDECIIKYQEWGKDTQTGKPYIIVEASLAALSRLSKRVLTIEQIRESLNEHLSERFLGILQDRRTSKAGRGASKWQFSLQLWSIDGEINYREFKALWQEKKQSRGNDVLPKVQPQVDQQLLAHEENYSDIIHVANLHNFLEPYEQLIQDIVDLIKEYLKPFDVKTLSESGIKKILLNVIQSISRASNIIVWRHQKSGAWIQDFHSHADTLIYSEALENVILPNINEKKIFSKESHGIIVDYQEITYILVPLRKTYSVSDSTFIAICDIRRDAIFLNDPFGAIISTIYSLDNQKIVDSDVVEAEILDSLKESFRFVSIHLYQRRFKLFHQRLKKMTVHFQPIVKLDPLVLEAWEALARDPLSTLAAPADLFRAAEMWGVEFKTELDLYFLKVATKEYNKARNKLQLKRYHEFLPLSVNVYPDSLMRSVYLETVQDIVKSKIIPPGKLILEISEKSALPQTSYWNDEKLTWESFRRRLREYARKGTGVRFAIDDFGVGHASVSRLIGLNLEYVKIDREVLNYTEEVRDRVVTFVHEALIEADHYTPHIIIEGVDQNYPISLRGLLDIGANSIQGYIVDKPVSEIYGRLSDDQYKQLQQQLVDVM
ncbi:EAL domain-containing protein [Calothrix rhizosoleniae]|uniref:EAL domain-containing protein n=1 Tax=Calothrix rhizosoleniae TaxID=888997 RepID=UPI000B49E525|nr:EAL domain-containing protein [Calothrix rhizosoleniae]